MLITSNPSEAYRRVDFDARVEGADQAELVRLCIEQMVDALGLAIIAEHRGDNATKSRALTRALAAATALLMGVSGDSEVARALRHVYEAARRAILDSVLAFDESRLAALRDDFRDIARAMRDA
ncbi:MAG: flagellar protein FliS [Novosphingobium sp.]|nr:flagellar protein FliS [Novosphingobium sp.]